MVARKNISIANFMITSNLYKVCLDDEIVFNDGPQHLDRLLQKWLKYQYHQLKYEESLKPENWFNTTRLLNWKVDRI